MYRITMGLEAIRAYLTIQKHWQRHQEVYVEANTVLSGKAATYLLFSTNTHIHNLISNFVNQYHSYPKHINLKECPHFKHEYEVFLHTLNHEVNFYARTPDQPLCVTSYEETSSIFKEEVHSTSLCKYALT